MRLPAPAVIVATLAALARYGPVLVLWGALLLGVAAFGTLRLPWRRRRRGADA